MKINIKKNHPDAIIPVLGTDGAAAFDLSAIEDTFVNTGTAVLVKTGLSVAIPVGYAGLVCSRSGLALKKRVFVLNAPGIVDSDYRGDIGVILYNAGEARFDIKKGDRIAQFMISIAIQASFTEVDNLDETNRGVGGFGSTGIKG